VPVETDLKLGFVLHNVKMLDHGGIELPREKAQFPIRAKAGVHQNFTFRATRRGL